MTRKYLRLSDRLDKADIKYIKTTISQYGEMISKNTFRGMFESAVDDSSEDFGLKEKIPESGTVDRDVRSLHLLLSGPVGGGRSGIGGGFGLVLLLVVQKIVVSNIGHCI